MAAARPYLPQSPPPDPLAPGPFAFADPDRVRSVLAEAGFARIAITPCDSRLPIGTPAAAAELLNQVGPLSRALAEASPEQQAAAGAAVLAMLEAQAGPDGVSLGGACWLVAAYGG